MTKIFQTLNPMWLADTFVFKEHKDLGTVYIKVNHQGKIEEIGVNIRKRMHMPDDAVLNAEPATKSNIRKLNLIGDEYWWGIHNFAKRLNSR